MLLLRASKCSRYIQIAWYSDLLAMYRCLKEDRLMHCIFDSTAFAYLGLDCHLLVEFRKAAKVGNSMVLSTRINTAPRA
jgi:hypothetical protein